jgi:hypothetical protein
VAYAAKLPSRRAPNRRSAYVRVGNIAYGARQNHMVIDRQWHLSSFLSVLLVATQTGSLCAAPLFHAQTPKLDKRVLPTHGNKLQARVAVSIVKPKEASLKKDDLKANKQKDAEKQAKTASTIPVAPMRAEPAQTEGTKESRQDKSANAKSGGTPDAKAASASQETPSVLAYNVDSAAMRALEATAQSEMRQAHAADPNLTAGTDFSFAKMFGWLNGQSDSRHQRLNGRGQSSQPLRGMTYEDLVTTYGITGMIMKSDPTRRHQVITHIFPTTPASGSDIQVGDVLLMANDHLFYGDEGQVEVWRVITGPPHTTVDMVFSRHGSKYKVTLRRMNIEEIADARSRFYFQRCFHQLGALNAAGN